MPTNTSAYNFFLPIIGGDNNAWGTFLNSNWSDIDNLLSGISPLSGIDINSGTADSFIIGSITPAAGAFTTVSTSSAASLNSVVTDLIVASTTGVINGNWTTNGNWVFGGQITAQATTGIAHTFSTSVNNGNDIDFVMRKARGGATITRIAAFDRLGTIIWQGYDGAQYNQAASISAVATTNTGDFDTRLEYIADAHRFVGVLDLSFVSSITGITPLLPTLPESVWVAGTSTTEAVTSPAKVRAAVQAGIWTSFPSVNLSGHVARDVRDIPTSVNEIEILFTDVSLNGDENILFQLGVAGSPITTGYVARSGNFVTAVSSTVGFPHICNSAGGIFNGRANFKKVPSTLTWDYDTFGNFNNALEAPSFFQIGRGRVTLAGDVNMLRFRTTVGRFDSGSFVLQYR